MLLSFLCAFSFCTITYNDHTLQIDSESLITKEEMAQYAANATKVELNNVETIAQGAFEGFALLEEASINAEIIGMNAFKNCPSLNKVVIGSNATEIGLLAFTGCKNLANVEVSDNNKYYKSLNNVVYTKEMDKVVFCPEGVASVELYDGLIIVAPHAFENCASLTEVKIPSTVRVIGDSSFVGCVKLQTIVIPSSVQSIGANAFTGCSILNVVKIGSGTKSISTYAFDNMEGLTSFEVDENNNYYSAVNGALLDGKHQTIIRVPEALNNFVIPETVTKIEEGSFKKSKIENIVLPSSVQTIGKNAFLKSSLKMISFAENMISIGDFAFSETALETVTIPGSVKNIGSYAFSRISGLTKVVFCGSNDISGGELIFDGTTIDSVYVQESYNGDSFLSLKVVKDENGICDIPAYTTEASSEITETSTEETTTDEHTETSTEETTTDEQTETSTEETTTDEQTETSTEETTTDEHTETSTEETTTDEQTETSTEETEHTDAPTQSEYVPTETPEAHKGLTKTQTALISIFAVIIVIAIIAVIIICIRKKKNDERSGFKNFEV